MNAPVPPLLQPRRRYGRWVLLALVVMVTPLVIVGVGVASMFTLSRDAAVLRREVMAATDADWHTKVQVSVGGITLGAVRTGLQFVQAEHMDEARLALAAVRSASVGVYESNERVGELSLRQLFTRTDQRMRSRGWSRVVGVAEGRETVMVYASDDPGSDGRIELCVAVVDGRQMVVVSTRINGDALQKLVERHVPKGELRGKFKLAGI
jgi:hypothetical protein